MPKVAKHAFEEFADVSEVSQPSPSAKMAWCKLIIAVFRITLLTSLPSTSWSCKALTALCWPFKHGLCMYETIMRPLAPLGAGDDKLLFSFTIFDNEMASAATVLGMIILCIVHITCVLTGGFKLHS